MRVEDLENSVETIKNEFKTLFPENLFEIVLSYFYSFSLAIIIFFVGFWLSKKVVGIVGRSLRKIEIIDETFIKFVENFLYYTLLTIVILSVLNNLGVKTSSILAILGAAGLAIGLAIKDSLGNFASGIMIVLFKPFKVGDTVTAGGVSGTVTEVTIFSTIFQTSDNQKIIVPNSFITKGAIVNINANDTRRVDIVVGISYEDNIKKAKEILENIVASNPKVLKDKSTNIFVSDLAQSSINLSINVWVKSEDFSTLKAQLLEEIKNKFDEEKITIPYPTQYVYQYNKN